MSAKGGPDVNPAQDIQPSVKTPRRRKGRMTVIELKAERLACLTTLTFRPEWMAIAAPNIGGPSTIGRVSLDTEGGEFQTCRLVSL